MDKYEILKYYFGYDAFKYPQDKIIDEVIKKEDCIGILPTGYGKSIIYQVLALMLDGVTIILSPLIALMEDQVASLKRKGISAALINSCQDSSIQEVIYHNLLKNKYKMIYLAPERLKNKRFLEVVLKTKIALLVVDEAHTLLWGEGFRKSYKEIGVFIDRLPFRPRILALTATATHQTLFKIKAYLHLSSCKCFTISMDRKNLFYRVIHPKNKRSFLLNYLKNNEKKKGIIYCLTRKTVEDLHKDLQKISIDSFIYHGGLSIEERKNNQKQFFLDEFALMVCTNAFGMGIDIPNIRFVIAYDIPQSIEDLVQQMGRASRDGQYGEGIVLFSFKDIHTVEYFIEENEKQIIKKDQERKLTALVDYCLTRKCRHQFISSYFGQKANKCLDHCDNCKKK